MKPIDFIKRMRELREPGPEKEKDSVELTEEEEVIVYLLKEGTVMQDMRKECAMKANHILNRFLNEFSKRLNVDKSILLNATFIELPTLMRHRDILDRIKKRMEMPVSIYYKEDTLLVGVYEGRLHELKTLGEIKELRGTPASPGYVKGYVKIVKTSDDFRKFKQGDILVAEMTRPDYVPVMTKAKAILTDEGGLTSHAAIVSRELGVPCIVGLNIATTILKDGDYIEVDANQGIVRILKH